MEKKELIFSPIVTFSPIVPPAHWLALTDSRNFGETNKLTVILVLQKLFVSHDGAFSWDCVVKTIRAKQHT